MGKRLEFDDFVDSIGYRKESSSQSHSSQSEHFDTAPTSDNTDHQRVSDQMVNILMADPLESEMFGFKEFSDYSDGGFIPGGMPSENPNTRHMPPPFPASDPHKLKVTEATRPPSSLPMPPDLPPAAPAQPASLQPPLQLNESSLGLGPDRTDHLERPLAVSGPPAADPVINIVAPEDLAEPTHFHNEAFPMYTADGKPVEGKVMEFHHPPNKHEYDNELLGNASLSSVNSGQGAMTPYGTPRGSPFMVPGTPHSTTSPDISPDLSPLIQDGFISPYNSQFDPFGEEAMSPFIEEENSAFYDPSQPGGTGPEDTGFPPPATMPLDFQNPHQPLHPQPHPPSHPQQPAKPHHHRSRGSGGQQRLQQQIMQHQQYHHPPSHYPHPPAMSPHQQPSHQQPSHQQPPHQQPPHPQPPHQQPPHQQPPHQPFTQPGFQGGSLTVPRRKSRALSDSWSAQEQSAFIESMDAQSLMMKQESAMDRLNSRSPSSGHSSYSDDNSPQAPFPSYTPINIVRHSPSDQSLGSAMYKSDLASGFGPGEPGINSRSKGLLGVPQNTRTRSMSSPYEPTNDLKAAQMFSCELCGKRFTRAYNLRSHMRTHTDERPFSCQHCGKAFARQHDRKRHEALHSGQKRFVCLGLTHGFKWGCQKRFARADALGRHFRTEAGKNCLRPLIDQIYNNGTNKDGAPEGILFAGIINNQPQLTFAVPERDTNSGMTSEEREEQTRRTVIITAVAEQLQDLLREQAQPTS